MFRNQKEVFLAAVAAWNTSKGRREVKSVPFVVSRSISCIAGVTEPVHDEMTTWSRNSDMTLLLCVVDIVTAIRACGVVLRWQRRL